MIGVVGGMDVVVRTEGDPASLAASLEKIVHQLDSLLVVSQVHTMDEIVTATESSRRFNTAILTAFAAIALGLSLLGIYGVLAYTVEQRTREIAIRMALGATRATVLLRTLRFAMNLAIAGVAAGLAASLGLMQFLKSLLYGGAGRHCPSHLARQTVPSTHDSCRSVTCQWRRYISITSLRSASRLAGRV